MHSLTSLQSSHHHASPSVSKVQQWSDLCIECFNENEAEKEHSGLPPPEETQTCNHIASHVIEPSLTENCGALKAVRDHVSQAPALTPDRPTISSFAQADTACVVGWIADLIARHHGLVQPALRTRAADIECLRTEEAALLRLLVHIESQLTESQLAESQLVESQLTQSQVVESQQNKPQQNVPQLNDSQLNDSQQTESQQTESRLTESRLAESWLTESQLVESQLVESQQTESQQNESQQVELQGTESQEVELQHAESRLTVSQQDEVKSGMILTLASLYKRLDAQHSSHTVLAEGYPCLSKQHLSSNSTVDDVATYSLLAEVETVICNLQACVDLYEGKPQLGATELFPSCDQVCASQGKGTTGCISVIYVMRIFGFQFLLLLVSPVFCGCLVAFRLLSVLMQFRHLRPFWDNYGGCCCIAFQ